MEADKARIAQKYLENSFQKPLTVGGWRGIIHSVRTNVLKPNSSLTPPLKSSQSILFQAVGCLPSLPLPTAVGAGTGACSKSRPEFAYLYWEHRSQDFWLAHFCLPARYARTLSARSFPYVTSTKISLHSSSLRRGFAWEIA